MAQDANSSDRFPNVAAMARVAGDPAMSDDERAVAAAAADGFVVPPACLPGVLANLAVLREYADILLDARRDDPL